MTENKAKVGDWDDFNSEEESNSGQNSSDLPKTKYMDMSKPGHYKIRLVGKYIECRKHFRPYRATVQDSEKDIDPAWQAGFFPSRRYAINIIDKTGLKEGEVGELKVLEKGPTVFKHFANYKTVFGIHPSKAKGPDWDIEVKIPMKNGKPDKLGTEYLVTHMNEAPFTDAEKAMIKEQGLWDIEAIYKSTSAEKMQQMWDELPEEAKIPPKREDKDSEKQEAPKPKETSKVEETMADAPAESDDLFGDEVSSDADSGELF